MASATFLPSFISPDKSAMTSPTYGTPHTLHQIAVLQNGSKQHAQYKGNTRKLHKQQSLLPRTLVFRITAENLVSRIFRIPRRVSINCSTAFCIPWIHNGHVLRMLQTEKNIINIVLLPRSSTVTPLKGLQ